MGASVEMIRKLEEVDPKIRDVFLCFIDEVEVKSQVISVGRGDFSELRDIVRDLAQAQGRTEQRVEDLAQAQGRTEQSVKELADAQGRTEERVGDLAQAQGRTEQRVGGLAERVEELVESQKQGFQALTDQIAALGSRWGIYNEGTFRGTIRGLMSKVKGVEVREGYYGDRQVDVIIRNGEHVMLEITSRMHPKDIAKLYASADDYQMKEGISPSLMVATSYISPRLMEKIYGA